MFVKSASNKIMATEAATCRLAAKAALRSAGGRSDFEAAYVSQSDTMFSLLTTLSGVLKPLHQLDALVQFESLRQEANPLLPKLRKVVDEISSALAANGAALAAL